MKNFKPSLVKLLLLNAFIFVMFSNYGFARKAMKENKLQEIARLTTDQNLTGHVCSQITAVLASNPPVTRGSDGAIIHYPVITFDCDFDERFDIMAHYNSDDPSSNQDRWDNINANTMKDLVLSFAKGDFKLTSRELIVWTDNNTGLVVELNVINF